MGPQDVLPGVHQLLDLVHPQVARAAAAVAEIRLQLVHPRVDLLVLRDEGEVLLERGHPRGEPREHVRLLDVVVHRQRLDEL